MSRSPALTGGEGFSYERKVAAYYLMCMLMEQNGSGIPTNATITAIALQQSNIHPMDDVVIYFEDKNTYEKGCLELQVKQASSSPFSFTASTYVDVFQEAWKTFYKNRSSKKHLFGVVAENYVQIKQDFDLLCDYARNSADSSFFENRDLNQAQINIKEKLRKLSKISPNENDIWQFFARFYALESSFDSLSPNALSSILNDIKSALPEGSKNKNEILWERLCLIAEHLDTKAGSINRHQLQEKLKDIILFSPRDNFFNDFKKLQSYSKSNIQAIRNDIDDIHVRREVLFTEFKAIPLQKRLIFIQGEAGTGKSVFLRSLAEEQLENPILFLKADSLRSSCWIDFKTEKNLISLPENLSDFLKELSACSKTYELYIDGLDRTPKIAQNFIREIFQTLSKTESLLNWRIICTLRDSAIDPVLEWLNGAEKKLDYFSFPIHAFNSEEIRQLPFLQNFLANVSEKNKAILCRPFFASILTKLKIDVAIASESDLARRWWHSLEEEDKNYPELLEELSRLRSFSLSTPIFYSKLSQSSKLKIGRLKNSGFLREGEDESELFFSHDIYFEWSLFSYYRTLQTNEWVDQVKQAGQPPALARIIELLSQSYLAQAKDKECKWIKSFVELKNNSRSLRSQWMRVWLFGGLSLPNFHEKSHFFGIIFKKEHFSLFIQLLFWMKAEKTVPDPFILFHLKKEMLAELSPVPVQMSLWENLIQLVLQNVLSIKEKFFSDILEFFVVFQRINIKTKTALQKEISKNILSQCQKWIEKYNDTYGKRDFLREVKNVLYRASIEFPEFSRKYLQGLLAQAEIEDREFKLIQSNALILSHIFPSLVVDITLKFCKEKLPDEEMSGRERDFHYFSLDDSEVTALSLKDHYFYPTSPLAEPFSSLFVAAPEEGIRVVRELCNHAVISWRQWQKYLHLLPRSQEKNKTPLPLEIEFPWGKECFWGATREYGIYRGDFAPQCLEAAFYVLDAWTEKCLKEGKDPDNLIQQIVMGNHFIPILGIASTILLEKKYISETGFALIRSQRLLNADQKRFENELSKRLFNFPMQERGIKKALENSNNRAVRQKKLSDMIPYYVCLAPEDLKEKVLEIVKTFPNNLEYEFEEDKQNPQITKKLKEAALNLTEYADPKCYSWIKNERENQANLYFQSQRMQQPPFQEKVRQSVFQLTSTAICWNATNLLQGKGVPKDICIGEYFKFAKKLYENRDKNIEEETTPTKGEVILSSLMFVLAFPDSVSSEDFQFSRELIRKIGTEIEVRFPIIYQPSYHDAWLGAVTAKLPQIFPVEAYLAFGTKILLLSSDSNPEHQKADISLLHKLVIHPHQDVRQVSLYIWRDLIEKKPYLLEEYKTALKLSFAACCVRMKQANRITPPIPERYLDISEDILLEDIIPQDVWKIITTDPNHRGKTEHLVPPEIIWDYNEAGRILTSIPVISLLKTKYLTKLQQFGVKALCWTEKYLNPPLPIDESSNLIQRHAYEWLSPLGIFLGEISLNENLQNIAEKYFPLFTKIPLESFFLLTQPFIEKIIFYRIYESEEFSDEDLKFLEAFVEKFLLINSDDSKVRDSLHWYDEMHAKELLKCFFFYTEEKKKLLQVISPKKFLNMVHLVEKTFNTMIFDKNSLDYFLKFCENTREIYPIEKFSEQVLELFNHPTFKIRHGSWDHYTARRISNLVSFLAQKYAPLSKEVSLNLLKILDYLIDHGDIRAASLQKGEFFRELQQNIQAHCE